jgi:hypothetical protein
MRNRRHFLNGGVSVVSAGLAGAAALIGGRRSLAEQAGDDFVAAAEDLRILRASRRWTSSN